MNCSNLASETKHYKFLAYIVLRDSVAFYLGIPKFLEEDNLKKVLREITLDKIEKAKGRGETELTQKEYDRCIQAAKRSLSLRIKEVQEDFIRCEEVLFKDNLWLQLLDLDETFFQRYFDRLDEQAKEKLAVVPKFKTRDHSLGRPYINDNFLGGVQF